LEFPSFLFNRKKRVSFPIPLIEKNEFPSLFDLTGLTEKEKQSEKHVIFGFSGFHE
jgi:hypothetical protein